jgi:hypothetical protein
MAGTSPMPDPVSRPGGCRADEDDLEHVQHREDQSGNDPRDQSGDPECHHHSNGRESRRAVMVVS